MNDFPKIFVLSALFIGIAISMSGQAPKALGGREALSGYLDDNTYQRLYHSNNLNPILKSKETSTPWVVWADRDGVNIYSVMNGVTPIEQAEFLEEFTVLDAKPEGWFHVGRKTVAGLQPVGWIKSNNLILHQNALKNQYAGAQKRMILTPLEEVKRAGGLSDVTFTSFLRIPERGSAVQSKASRFSIFFALKKENDRDGNEFVLLASSSIIKVSTAQSEILGWIPASALTEWNSRVGLDFAAGSKASGAYGNFPIVVAENEDDAKRFHQNQAVRIPLQTTTISPEPRRNISTWPFPDIELTDDLLGIHEVVAIVNNGKKGAVPPEASEEMERYLESLQIINLFFVIDGTMSMQPYIDVVKSLASNIALFNQGRDYKIRMGFAVYRDFPDGKGKLLEPYPVTPDMDAFQDRIAQITCYSTDRDKPEAFYYGISEGLKESGMLTTQTNLVILLGDVGNHRSTAFEGTNFDYNRALSALIEYDASLFVYQVSGGLDWSYMDFGLDATRFARDIGGDDREMVRRKDGFELERDANDLPQPYVQVYFGDKSGRSVSVKDLQSTLESVLTEYIDLKKRLSTQVGRVVSTGNPPDSAWVRMICEHMMAKGHSKAACEMLNSQELAASGFVSVRTQDREVRCFSPYIFFTQSEIDQMNLFMTDLSGPITGANAGKQFRDVFLRMAVAFSGDDDSSRFEEWTVKRLWEEFFQLPCGLSFANIRIKDLPTDLSAVCGAGSSDPLCLEIAEMQDAANKFRDRYGDWQWKPNPAMKERFYWIPLHYFPGADADY